MFTALSNNKPFRVLVLIFALGGLVFSPIVVYAQSQANANCPPLQVKKGDGTCECPFGDFAVDWSPFNITQTNVCDFVVATLQISGTGEAGASADSALAPILQALVNIVTVLTIMAAAVAIVWGGYLYMTAAGNGDQVRKAKVWIASALLGIALALAAWLILSVISPNLV